MITSTPLVSTQNIQIASIFTAIAEIMADQNVPYYSEETSELRNRLREDHKINLTAFKSRYAYGPNGESIVDMLQDEQILFTLFAVAFVESGELPS
jgi:hypothetical protein